MKVRIVRVDKSLPLPEYKTEGAVAFDIYSREDVRIEPKAWTLAPSNLIIEVPSGYFLLIAARSGTFKKGLWLANGVGILDGDYHGPEDEAKIALYNFSDSTVEISRGERVAQGLILPVQKAEWQEVDVIKENSRGGFGSTGDL